LTGVVWWLLALLSWLVLEKYSETATNQLAGRMRRRTVDRSWRRVES
jgi:hypothetical protein